LRRIRAAFRSRRLLLASLLLVVSLGLLGAGVAGMLLASNDNGGIELTEKGVPDPIGTATSTVPTSPGSSAPVARLIIDKIGVDAPVVTMGVDENGIPQVPDNPYDVVWYNFSSEPGTGSNAVFAGHVDWTVNDQPVIGVFYYLRDLEVGDIVEVKLEDGTDYKYSVIGNQAIPDEDPQALQKMAATPADMITLITCGGIWTSDPSDPLGGRYDHRQVVRAELIGAGPDQGQIAGPGQEDSQG
jgi:LPXTG-site transpeptidase (sortase) family protein